MGTLNLTTADNDLTLTVNGTLIKQLYVNSTKVYQKWKTENYTETQNTYDNQKLTSVNINKEANIYKHLEGHSITYTANIAIMREKVAETCETFDAFYFTVYCDGTLLHTSNIFSTNNNETVAHNITIGTWRNYGPDGTGNYNNIRPIIGVTVYVYEGTGFVAHSFESQFPIVTSKPSVEGTTISKVYSEVFPLNIRAYKSMGTVSGTRRVEDN